MQLTRFDRWLRERFVYETHIQTLRPPESIPKGIRAKALPDTPGKRFKHLFIASNTKIADAFIANLKDANLMFSTTVVDRQTWFVPWLAPKGKSISWMLLWIVLGGSALFFGGRYLVDLFSSPELRKMISEAIDILKK